jgi:hypothetical protein
VVSSGRTPSPRIYILGAHYDTVAGGPERVDNAAGVASVVRRAPCPNTSSRRPRFHRVRSRGTGTDRQHAYAYMHVRRYSCHDRPGCHRLPSLPARSAGVRPGESLLPHHAPGVCRRPGGGDGVLCSADLWDRAESRPVDERLRAVRPAGPARGGAHRLRRADELLIHTLGILWTPPATSTTTTAPRRPAAWSATWPPVPDSSLSGCPRTSMATGRSISRT